MNIGFVTRLYFAILLFLLLNSFTTTSSYAQQETNKASIDDSVNTTERTTVKIAEGIYVIRHKDAPDLFPQSNTTVIIGQREVMVVDSCYLPSAASEDIVQIRQWTDKPIRYLLNTHWHYDHTMGNGTYAATFPALAIIAHIETGKQMAGYNPWWFDAFPKKTITFQRVLETGKNEDGTPLTADRRRILEQILPGREPVENEFKQLTDRMPNILFEQELKIDLGDRIVEIKHLGRGNTAGDAVVYLPKEQIMIAGDLLDHPVPYLGGGYPSELITTLQRMAQFEMKLIVPGHGRIMSDSYAKNYLHQVIELLQVVVSQVSKEIYRLGNGSRNLVVIQEAVTKAIDLTAWREKFAGNDKDNQEFFDQFSLPGLITAAYAELWRR